MEMSSSSLKASRKRGPNYTEAEKENLMFLAKKYNNIIECKSTGTNIFKKKQDAWEQVTKSYNACATTGIRTAEQLKHLYENKKQNARKALASSNKADYLRTLGEETIKRSEVLESMDKYYDDEDIPDMEILKSLDKSDKIERTKTGGGSFTPAIQSKDLKVLELIKEQVEPLPNAFDSAAPFFKDNIQTQEQGGEKSTKEENVVVFQVIDEEGCDNIIEKPKGHNIKIKKTQKYKPDPKKPRKETNGPMKTANLKKNNLYKNLYFKTKYQNAILEKIRLYQDIRLRQREHLLITKKLKLEISILEKQN